jgi:hypothetical protein
MKKADYNRVEEIRRTHRKDWYVNIHFLLSIIDKQDKVVKAASVIGTSTAGLRGHGMITVSVEDMDDLNDALKELEGDK